MRRLVFCGTIDFMATSSSTPQPAPRANFATTRWSLVLAAGQHDQPTSRQALAELCEAYWYPVYAYVRRRSADVHQAQDLTQEFFQRLLEQQAIAGADRSRGRFRAYLLTACKRFLINEWHADRAVKRGGGTKPISLDFEVGESRYAGEAIDSRTPELLFEQQWAITLLARVIEKLENKYSQKGKLDQFQHLKAFLSGSNAPGAYADAAATLGVSEGAVKVAAHRLRSQYRELVRAEIAQTVASDEDVDEEIRRLFDVLGGSKSPELL